MAKLLLLAASLSLASGLPQFSNSRRPFTVFTRGVAGPTLKVAPTVATPTGGACSLPGASAGASRAAEEACRGGAGSPCGKAGRAYVQAINDGEGTDRAGLLAARAFLDAAVASSSKPGGACVSDTDSFLNNGGGSIKMSSFLNASGDLDPVCNAAGGAFIDARIAGKTEEEAFNGSIGSFITAIQEYPEDGQGCLSAASSFFER